MSIREPDVLSPEDLAQEFAGIARVLEAQPSLKTTLDAVCALSAEAIGAAHVAITLIKGRSNQTVAANSDVALKVDAIQYGLGQGPCVDAMVEHELFYSPDLDHEQRWPRFVEQIVGTHGLHSMVSHRLYLRDNTFGCINVYDPRRDAFSGLDQRALAMFATHAAVAIDAASHHEQAEQLQRALETNRTIATAIGITMVRENVSREQAHELLKRRSQNVNQKLNELAAEIVNAFTSR